MNKSNNQNMMIGIIVVAVIAALIGLFLMRGKIGTGLFSFRPTVADLCVVNDSSDTISSAFMRNGKMMSQVVKPGEKATGGKGLIRIFVAKKNGNYEIQYPYPRPAGKSAEITLTQILKAAHTPELGQEMYTEKGKIDDIRVDYEEVRDLE